MSALRLGRLPDGTRDIRIIDDGVTARLHASRMGIKGGYGNPVIGGSFPVGVTQSRVAYDKARNGRTSTARVELVVCDKAMRHARCARSAGHGGDHSSREAMDRKAAHRRSGLLAGSIARVRARDGW